MKRIKNVTAFALTVSVLAAPFAAFAADQADKPKPDQLTTCPVSGDKLGEMGKPYVFTYQDREVKLCCKDCLKDFKKDPAKYLQKIEAADKTAKTDKSK